MEELLEALRTASDFLSRPLFNLGTAPISTSSLIKLAAFLLAAFWISKVARLALKRVLARRRLAQATLYALDRLLNYTILTIGILIGLSAIGIDFTTFAVLAGALGVGIGFGLQPLVANFVSGIILLLDRSIRVTDFIELESGPMGQVKMINMRTTTITTNDNVDILIPNSELTTGRIVNWTLFEEAMRLHIPFGVAYGSDKEVVRTAALEAAETYMAKRAPRLFAPVLDYLRDAGDIRSASDIEEHFARRFDVECVTTTCEYLADQGLIAKASSPVRATKRSSASLPELAFFLPEGLDGE